MGDVTGSSSPGYRARRVGQLQNFNHRTTTHTVTTNTTRPEMCFFIPLQFGCPTKIAQVDAEKDDIRICPQCHNAAVTSCKSRMWFEFCFLPIIPFKSKKVWLCTICRWQAINNGQGPQAVSHFPPPGGGYNAQPPMTAPNVAHTKV
ncbi:hypothetical protein PCANC_00790 [Puccinia coronata f. sp. avenae]|uniref:Zinc-ribbon 15 domain-containing protein n=2 Tax=Puccinia coronata f. sp. avenae TaxID=200324 RepID=A0A2N5TE81_9BASI|nr:hypothetical protein PCASD_10633 [Puccinia coronata f. sp. avenae]PLW58203.1 hypothetical protein PCANC_00790 [Puccinia coronata f. sp. avenae]